MDRTLAGKIYDLLVAKAGANPRYKETFIHDHLEIGGHGSEWRFMGSLGFGGKFRTGRLGREFRVDCYPEDITPGRQKLVDELNADLKAIEESAS